MNFDYSEDQKFLRGEARKFLDARCPVSRTRAVLDDAGTAFDREGLKLTRLRNQTALSRGQTPGPEAAIGKAAAARQMQEIATEAIDRLDQYGILADDDTASIVGGTDEILKNIIAERVLGLSPEMRVDRDVAFKDAS